MENTNVKSSPKDVFLHLLATITLFVSVVGFLVLLFQYIDILFPDQLTYFYSGALETIRLSTSALIVVFPVYILISWLLGRDFKADEGKRELRVRRWLLYFTLFISALTIIIDLVTLVFKFLSGESTIGFLLKTLAVLIVAAAVFGYYIWDIRRKALMVSRLPKLVAWVASIILAGTIVSGFFLVGSPARQRSMRFDQQRVNDLRTVQDAIIQYYSRTGSLPTDLAAVKTIGYSIPSDPQTAKAYEYITSSSNGFELCANFNLETQPLPKNINRSEVYPYGFENWTHGSGRVCFDRSADPQLYKGLKPVPIK